MTDDDLVRRLLVGACAQNDVAWSLMRAAADRIKALTAEHNATLARLAGAVAREIALTADFAWQVQRTDEQREAYEQALSVMEAERDRLREALEDIIKDYEPGYPLSHDVIKYVARAALKGETP